MTEPTLNPESGFCRLKIDLAYDGTNFAGWAKQPDQRTVQEEIENAISRLVRNKTDSIVAGRTDAGVHATHQIIHVDVPETGLEIGNFAYLLNRFLSADIRINSVVEAPPNFHARFSAVNRQYIYKILDGGLQLPPLQRFDVATWFRPLEVEALNLASAQMLGYRDFAAFCKYREGSTTIRTLTKFEWHRNELGYLVAEVVADAFCYSMVRNLVGAAVCVGEGRYPKEWMAQMLENKERISDSYVFPSRGLTLTSVEYPPDEELLGRISLTLGRRDSDF
ncbi:MAG: tRNA pseudouridine(38-40) synthase TruA [Actinomycetes bacterium]|jgi:tRNA pseudouridine38-40 synthase